MDDVQDNWYGKEYSILYFKYLHYMCLSFKLMLKTLKSLHNPGTFLVLLDLISGVGNEDLTLA